MEVEAQRQGRLALAVLAAPLSSGIVPMALAAAAAALVVLLPVLAGQEVTEVCMAAAAAAVLITLEQQRQRRQWQARHHRYYLSAGSVSNGSRDPPARWNASAGWCDLIVSL